MKQKSKKFMLSVCGTFFMLGVAFSKINIKVCLVFTAVFWVVAVFLLLWGEMLKSKPVIRDLATIGLIIMAYPAALYMVMGLGEDIAGLLRAIGNDIAGLMKFPLREKSIYALQRTLEEILQVKDYVVSLVIKTDDAKQTKTVEWHFNYLILGISAGCLLLIRALRCTISLLAVLFEWLSEWLKSREEETPKAEAAT